MGLLCLQNKNVQTLYPYALNKEATLMSLPLLCTQVYIWDTRRYFGRLVIFTKVVAVTGRALAGGLRALKTSLSSQSFLRTWPS